MDPGNTGVTFLDGISNIKITGPDLVCSSSTFSLQNGGTNVTWQVSSNLQKISYNSNSITVQANGNGEGFIEAILSTGTVRKDVWVGKPALDSWEVNNSECLFPQYIFRTNILAEVTSYKLVCNGQTIYANTTAAEVTAEPSLFNIPRGESRILEVSAQNSCGWEIIDIRSIYNPTFNDCGGGFSTYTVYPNPASSEVNIAPNTEKTTAKRKLQNLLYQQTSQIAKLFDFNGAFVKDIELAPSGTTKIDVSNLKEGLYFLKIQVREEEETYKIIVAH